MFRRRIGLEHIEVQERKRNHRTSTERISFVFLDLRSLLMASDWASLQTGDTLVLLESMCMIIAMALGFQHIQD